MSEPFDDILNGVGISMERLKGLIQPIEEHKWGENHMKDLEIMKTYANGFANNKLEALFLGFILGAWAEDQRHGDRRREAIKMALNEVEKGLRADLERAGMSMKVHELSDDMSDEDIEAVVRDIIKRNNKKKNDDNKNK